MKYLTVITFLILTASLEGKAQKEVDVRQEHFNMEDNVAIEGYDPVAYFTQDQAVEGSKKYTYAHDGITYHFSSADNRQKFKENPEKYEPQYGGWCAYAMGLDGEKVKINPETFKIVDGKLYLFYNQFFNNTLTDWNEDEAALKTKADRYWQQIIQ